MSTRLIYLIFQAHSCNVISCKPALVSKEEYEQNRRLVTSGNFDVAMQYASNQIMKDTYHVEKQQYQEEFSLPLKRNLLGLLTIPVFVNHVPCTFIVDTGAQVSGIKAVKLKEITIRKTQGSIQIGSIGGKQKKLQGLCADSFQFGALEYRNLPMVVLDEHDFSLRFGNLDLLSFDGIIGWDILSKLDFEMDDVQHRFIVLKNRFQLPHPNMIPGGFPCFLCKQEDGSVTLFGFDSGSKVSWIGEEAITQHHYEIVKEGNAFGYGIHGLEKMNLKIVKECRFFLDKANITLSNTMSGRTRLFDGFVFHGVFGNEIFKGRRIRLINSAGMVLLA